ncbi:hypothetical protein M0802_012212 [Mischocyttarus mexicanus]|nr:hypothetical protein M0802_012212 [Mischocyttarus mexicanus]
MANTHLWLYTHAACFAHETKEEREGKIGECHKVKGKFSPTPPPPPSPPPSRINVIRYMVLGPSVAALTGGSSSSSSLPKESHF